MPPELVTTARARLVRVPAVVATLSGIALLLGWFVFRESDPSSYWVHGFNIAISSLVVGAARWPRVPAGVVLRLGLVYHVLLCWGVSLAVTFGIVAATGSPPHITWTSLLIAVFPMLVPMPPRPMLITSVVAATSAPAALWILEATGRPFAWAEYVGVSISPTFAVVIAFIGARTIYTIGLDAARARQLGAYRLEEELGRGGMGEVWRASHRLLARPAAIKLIAADQLGDDTEVATTVLRRFEQEAQATAQLCSPHTVDVYDFGVASDGAFYYVMELLDGLDLQHLVERHGALPAARVIHILRQACHSLGEAHQSGLIHRDVKPANIHVCRYGPDFDFVKVLDFGLVKERSDDDPMLTRRDQLLGTPAFMAPEMVRGYRVDGRADLYGLGCVAYWLLTGALVFEAETVVAMAARHAGDPPERPSARTELPIPADLDDVILACLHKDPDARPADAAALSDRLAAVPVPAWSQHDARRWWQKVRPATARRAAQVTRDGQDAPRASS